MELQLLSALAAVALAVLAAAVLHGDAFAAHLHATGAAAQTVLAAYKDFVLLRFPHGVAAIVG